MILKVNHLVLSSDDFEKDSNGLISLGYEQIFTQQEIENATVKKKIFVHFQERHDVRYFAAKRSVSVELLNWRSTNTHRSCFRPLLGNVPPAMVSAVKQKKEERVHYWDAQIANLPTPISFLGRRDEPFQLNGLVVKTADIDASVTFWKKLGFQVEKQSTKIALLRFKSVLPQTEIFYLYLERDLGASFVPYLDNRGISCLSFLSSCVQKEKGDLIKEGIDVIDVGPLQINKKMLTIIFATGPCGELIEVIDIKDLNKDLKKGI